MTTYNHTPPTNGSSNDIATINDPMAELDAAIGNLTAAAALNGSNVVAKLLSERLRGLAAEAGLNDRIDNLGVEAGNANAEVTAARTAINYGTAPTSLSEALRYAAADSSTALAYGADETGVADSLAALDSLMTDIEVGSIGADVVFAPGTYSLSDSWEMGKSNVRYVGNGLPIITPSSTDTKPFHLTNCNYVTIDGFHFQDLDPDSHVGITEESHGIALLNCEHVLIQNCVFEGCGDESIDVAQCRHVIVRNCTFIGAPSVTFSGGALGCNTSVDVWFVDNYFIDGPRGQAIRVEVTSGIVPPGESASASKRVHIINNTIRGQKKGSSPSSALFYDDSAGTYTALTDAIDGSTGTNEAITAMQTADYIYVGTVTPSGNTTEYAQTYFDLGTLNNNAATLAAEYYNGAGWAALTITSDGTASGGATMAQDGWVKFTKPGDMEYTTVNSVSHMWIRFSVSAALDDITILEIEIADDGDGMGIAVVNGGGDVYDVEIRGNQVFECESKGISLEPQAARYIYGAIVTGNILRDGGGEMSSGGGLHRGAIHCNNDRVIDPVISNNTVKSYGASGNSSHHGIVIYGGTATGNTVNDVGNTGLRALNGATVTGNYVTAAGDGATVGNGILLEDDCHATGNHVTACYVGLYLAGEGAMVSGNLIRANVRGVRLADQNYVVHNVIIDNTAYGIILSGTSPYMIDNILLNNTTADILDSSSTTPVKIGKIGYLSKNNGTATVASGATTAVVTHGLGATPALDDISVTPTNNMGSATKFWITTPTSTQFTINVDADPTGSGATFVWSADVA